MSRTWKDTPYKVQQKKLMEKGIYQHKHDANSEVQDRSLTHIEEVSFKKAETKAINEFRQKLITEGKDFTEREGKSFAITDDHDCPAEIKEKLIVFNVVHLVHRKSYYSEYCTDAEHFDAQTGKDIRDGKIARCTPVLDSQCSYHIKERGKISKIKRKSRLDKIAKAYNSGSEEEDLYDLKPLSKGAIDR